MKDATETKPATEPKYIARVVASTHGFPEEEAEVQLDPRFNRAGRLMGFAEVGRSAEWTRQLEPATQLAKAYAKAVEDLNGREPTEAEMDEDGIVRITATVQRKRVRDPFGNWYPFTRWVFIEATF